MGARPFAAVALLLISATGVVRAEMTDQRLRNSASQAKDLVFPAELSTLLSVFSLPRTAINTPDGAVASALGRS